jgi:hypothetical protein
LGRQNGIATIGPFRRAARRTAALLALLGAGGACAALPSFVSGAGVAAETHRMSGAGDRLLARSVDAGYAFDIRCDAAGRRQKLQVRWGGGNRFRLTRLASVACIDDLNAGSHQPAKGFDTLMGRGKGRYNGRRGATIRFRFVDLGASGARDTAYIRVRSASGTTALELEGKLSGGDHRAR